MTEWRDIKGAPRGKPLLGEDGPRVLLGWAGTKHVTIGHYARYGDSGPIWRDTYGGPLIDPTHYMLLEDLPPLPQPPKDTP